MYSQQSEHNPPHFHAIYGEHMAAICINDGTILEGELPKKALEMVLEWSAMHKDELLKIWETQEFITLSPLEQGGFLMFHKVKNVNALPDFKLSVQFCEGVTKIYDVAPLLKSTAYFYPSKIRPSFSVL